MYIGVEILKVNEAERYEQGFLKYRANNHMQVKGFGFK